MRHTSTFLFLFICISCFSQTKIITKDPCTDAMAHTTKGKWIKTSDLGSYNSKETTSRIDEIQKMMTGIYPQPTGVDAAWHRSAGISYFGSKHKYYKTEDGRQTFDYSNLPHFIHYTYTSGFFNYWCDVNEKNVLHPGYPGETGTWINIIANTSLGNMAPDDDWTINGLPVIMKKPVVKKNDGIEFSFPEPGRNVYHVLVHRKGILPYIPVTRKQYLEYCIIYHTKIHDEVIKNFEKIPVRSMEEQDKEKKEKLDKFQKQYGNDAKKLKANVDYYLSGYQTDQQIRDERIGKAKKNKENDIKKFTDELEKTTQENLLDSPAMVLVKYYPDPVFETNPEKGSLLVTENPDYIRKELPRHVPQLFIVSLTWDDLPPLKKFAEIFQQDFPLNKLQAMIDK